MFRSMEAFLRYFDSVHRRALRDVAALPAEADDWTPAEGEGEQGWSINQLVGHMASSRLYFASAYRGEGWITPQTPDTSARERWLPALEASAVEFRAELEATPDDWLDRRVKMIDTDGELAGWRLLMMMLEHDIHHRSQIDTYAGMNGWGPPDIFNRSAETIAGLQPGQRETYRGGRP